MTDAKLAAIVTRERFAFRIRHLIRLLDCPPHEAQGDPYRACSLCGYGRQMMIHSRELTDQYWQMENAGISTEGEPHITRFLQYPGGRFPFALERNPPPARLAAAPQMIEPESAAYRWTRTHQHSPTRDDVVTMRRFRLERIELYKQEADRNAVAVWYRFEAAQMKLWERLFAAIAEDEWYKPKWKIETATDE